MLSTILVYVSLFLQVAAAVIAISLFKRTKFNASWILISVGFFVDGGVEGLRFMAYDLSRNGR